MKYSKSAQAKLNAWTKKSDDLGQRFFDLQCDRDSLMKKPAETLTTEDEQLITEYPHKKSALLRERLQLSKEYKSLASGVLMTEAIANREREFVAHAEDTETVRSQLVQAGYKDDHPSIPGTIFQGMLLKHPKMIDSRNRIQDADAHKGAAAEFAKRQKKAESRARGQLARDFDDGKIGQDEITAGQGEFALQTIQNSAKQGNINSETAKLLSDSVVTMAQQSIALSQMNDVLQRLSAAQKGIKAQDAKTVDSSRNQMGSLGW